MKKLIAATNTLKELALIYATMVATAAFLYMQIESVPVLDAIYWAGTTATSTGYGDLSPKTIEGRILALVLMHVSIFGVAPLIVVRLIDRLNEDRDAFTHDEQAQILEALKSIEGRLDRLEHSRN